MINLPTPDVKADTHRSIDSLPENATWDDIMYRIYVRQSIENGIQDANEGKIVPVDEVRRRFGLSV